jgi:hypothetical protein
VSPYEIDKLVAEKVMGWTFVSESNVWGEVTLSHWIDAKGKSQASFLLPHYSEDIKAAWLVVEKMQVTHNVTIQNIGATGYSCEFTIKYGGFHIAVAETVPLAICLAALHCFDVEVDLIG